MVNAVRGGVLGSRGAAIFQSQGSYQRATRSELWWILLLRLLFDNKFLWTDSFYRGKSPPHEHSTRGILPVFSCT